MQVIFTIIMGLIVLVAILGTYDNTKKISKQLKDTNILLQDLSNLKRTEMKMSLSK